MSHLICVSGIRCYAYHGCLEEEGRIGGHYTVDVVLETDFSEAALTDELSMTIDYCEAAKIVQEEMAIRSKLIEHAGHRIQRRMFSAFPRLKALELTVTKISPPIPGEVESVSVVFKIAAGG